MPEPSFADLSTEYDTTDLLSEGWYDATVKSAKAVLDEHGNPLRTLPNRQTGKGGGKGQIDVTFDVGDGYEAKRRYVVSWGTNQETGKPAAFVQFLMGCTGLGPDDPALTTMNAGHLVGKSCKIEIEHVERSGKTYANVVKVKKGAPAPAASKPKPAAQPPPEHVSEQAVTEEDGWEPPEDNDGEVSF